MHRRTRVLGLLGAASVLVVGFGEGGAAQTVGSFSDGTSTTECTEEQAGGELSFGIRNEPVGFDPLVSGTVGSLAGAERMAIFDTLMRYNPESAEWEPRMAESLEPNEDFSEWTLTLRDGITFGSGAPLDTAAVQFSVDRHLAEDSISLYKQTASVIESMEIVDDLTMVFHMTGPYGNFPSLLAGPIGMPFDPAVFEELGAEGFTADPHGAGAGPFTLVQWSPNEEIVLEAKDDYWDGPVCIETLRFVRIEENDARYEAFSNGEIDAAFIRTAPELAKAREDGVNLFANMSNTGYVVAINNGSFGVERPGSDLRVRQAIAYALEPGIIDQRLGGQGVPGSALVPETSVLYSDGIVGTPYDPERARELLDEVKAETGYDGSLHFVCNNTYSENAIAIEGLLEAVGFVVENDSNRSIQDWIAYFPQTQNDYDINCHGFSMTDTQPWETLNELVQGTNGQMGYADADMDAAMTALREAATVDEQREALVGVQEVWNETVPSVVYGHVEEAVVYSDALEGLQFTSETIAVFDEVRIVE